MSGLPCLPCSAFACLAACYVQEVVLVVVMLIDQLSVGRRVAHKLLRLR